MTYLQRRNTTECTSTFLEFKHRSSLHPPFGTLALTVQVCVSEPIDAKAQHVVCFEGFAEEVTITTTILQNDKKTIFEARWLIRAYLLANER